MSRSDDDGYAISYKVLERGTPVVTSDGSEIGSVREVLENVAEHIFDGLVIQTPGGERFVDAPEIARIAERRVTLTLDAEGAASLPERDPKGAPTFRANARGGRMSRLFGGGWKRD
jgi:sporulation protein YlmC with PRC-barrel domain